RQVFFTGTGLFAIGLSLSVKYVVQSGLATDLYNETIAKSSSASGKAEIQFGFVGNGAGLQVNF
ncbi:MAG TPA: hypothetical protein VEV15_08775, partial [Flavisolibacter sp.]|nr:hypothetical protein [Flavisolibacter sp.]